MLKPLNRLDKVKSSIKSSVDSFIFNSFPEKEVAVFLSGGADSTFVALSAHYLGKSINAFSFEMEGHPNSDCKQAEITSTYMGWKFNKVIVSSNDLSLRFIELIEKYGCKKKTEVECLFPMLDLIKSVKKSGFQKVLTGFGSFIPDDRKSAIECEKSPKIYWNNRRKDAGSHDSSATKIISDVAQTIGIKILMPLCQLSIIEAMNGLRTSQMMGRPYPKHHYKDIFYDDFEALNLLKIKNRSLQVSGGIEYILSPLLDDPEINPRGRSTAHIKYQLSGLCRRWGNIGGGKVMISKKSNKAIEIEKIPFKTYFIKDVIRNSSKEKFTVVSTFAGGGGSSTGYRLAGGKIKFINEFVHEAISTYSVNYPDTPINNSDIRKLNRNREFVEKLFRTYGVEKGDLDIFDGSPPCSTFSKATAGKGKDKIEKMDVSYSDTRQNRVGMLIHDYVFMANVIQPRVCVIENVPEIVKSTVFHEALNRLKRYGYIISYKKLVSSDYGVAQKRARLFVLAVRPDVAKKVGINSSEDLFSVFPKSLGFTYTIRDVLSGLEIDPRERDMLLSMTRKGAVYEIIKQLPINPVKHTRPIHVNAEWKSDFSLTRVSWDLPCPTITATGAAGRGGSIHPSENRIFTIAELKRLTGLPDDFKLTGSFEQKAERIGRMVPPLMSKALAENIYDQILK